jgi:hypothetical protein
MLVGHPRIHTAPEPWLMLHQIYAIRGLGIATEYDAGTASRALNSFLDGMGARTQPFLESVRLSSGYLYDLALQRSKADIFLDKTPRYYHVIDELREVFPRARMILLFRNPAAVLSSILHTHAAGDWTRLRRLDRMHDLVTAPRNMVRAIDRLGEWRTAVVRYEDLIANPDHALSALCERMEIEAVPGLKNYVASDAPLGDATTAGHSAPTDVYLDRWKRDLGSPAKRDVARSYLRALGPEIIERLGYDYRDLLAALSIHGRGDDETRWRMLSAPDESLAWWSRVWLSLAHSRNQRGVIKTILRIGYMSVFGHAWAGRDGSDHIDRRPV